LRYGLVVRDAHPGDRRRHAVKLSRAGKEKLHQLRDVGTRAEGELLEALSAAERKQLHSLLRKLILKYC